MDLRNVLMGLKVINSDPSEDKQISFLNGKVYAGDETLQAETVNILTKSGWFYDEYRGCWYYDTNPTPDELFEEFLMVTG